MPEDRLKKDFDEVENLSDLIEAREERDSAFADDVDAMEDVEAENLPRDEVDQLTFPHPHGRSEEYGKLGINTELMGTPDEKEVEFDWQDSAEEMLPTDPDPSEGMGQDDVIESIAHVEATDLAGPAPSVEVGSETGTAATEEEEEEYELDGGDRECPAPITPVPLDSAMDTDSDEYDFSIDEKFEGEVTREEAEYEFEQMDRIIEETEEERKESSR